MLSLYVVGTAEAASNAETTMTQLVQEYTIRAQVRALCNKTGLTIDRTERVANSLGHLAAVVDQLNDLDHPVKVRPHVDDAFFFFCFLGGKGMHYTSATTCG